MNPMAKLFKYLGRAKDYEGCWGHPIPVAEDKFVMFLNRLAELTEAVREAKGELEIENENEKIKPMLEQLYEHCKGMVERTRRIEDKLEKCERDLKIYKERFGELK